MDEPNDKPRYTDRGGRKLRESELPTAVREAIARKRAERQQPGYQDQLERDIAAIREEFPPKGFARELIDIGAALRIERERQGLSLTDVHERTGISRAQISNVETGKVPNPTMATLRQIARALGKSIEIRLVDVEPPTRWVKVDVDRLAEIRRGERPSGYFDRKGLEGLAVGDRVALHDPTGKAACIRVLEVRAETSPGLDQLFIRWDPSPIADAAER